MSSDPNSITGWGEFLELESENKDEWESNKWVDYTELIGKLDVEALEDCERWMKEIIKTCEHIKGCISAYGYYMKTNQPDKAANVLKENGLSYQKRLSEKLEALIKLPERDKSITDEQLNSLKIGIEEIEEDKNNLNEGGEQLDFSGMMAEIKEGEAMLEEQKCKDLEQYGHL
ncbi:hypothetical protein GX50_01907 [[Emmonsia] crescens]|uniref:Uncharacterized protein n=1 Tax=[Emmonsia] crescens TaxID=73230 RepID=A0A2B7ZPB1_9EURO|nr:hypothetical protein GX50_01907 [Emmonsia crescens]